MKIFACFLIGMLLFSQCKREDKYVYSPSTQHSAIPVSLAREHENLLSKAALLAAGKDSIATALYELMKYHFNEEEQYVFPALAFLPGLAAGNIPEAQDSIIDLTMRFKSNSAKLLAEHQVIQALMQEYKLRHNAQDDPAFIAFEEELAAHAKAEEDIYFPAAIVIGDYLKLKATTRNQ